MNDFIQSSHPRPRYNIWADRDSNIPTGTLVFVAGGDEAVVELLRSGDEDAFTELVERYHTRLIRFALAFVASRSAAEDVAQDTWAAVIAGLSRFEGRSSLQTWIFQICANRARTHGGREHRTVPLAPEEPTVEASRFNRAGAWSDPPEPWPSVDDRLEADALAPLVRAAIDRLPEVQRQVVTLRDVEGLTAQEACEVLSISEGNQRVLLHRGRAGVRAAVERGMGEVWQ
jgi:RNA polymerase sigma-70 factor, ECF subfamily